MEPVVAIAVTPMRDNWNVNPDGTVVYRQSYEKNFVVIGIFGSIEKAEPQCAQYLRDYRVDDEHPPIEYIVFWSSKLNDLKSAILLPPALTAEKYVQYPFLVENTNGLDELPVR